jgi:hypothetical protein
MELSAPMLRCGKVDSTSPLCMMMPCHLFDDASNVRGMETSIQGMQCHSISPSDKQSSRNVEQANQEYPLEDSVSNGQKLEEQA